LSIALLLVLVILVAPLLRAAVLVRVLANLIEDLLEHAGNLHDQLHVLVVHNLFERTQIDTLPVLVGKDAASLAVDLVVGVVRIGPRHSTFFLVLASLRDDAAGRRRGATY
jgi:hypothetical protein